MKRDELRTVVAAVGLAEVTVGTNIQRGFKRLIYRIKFINQFAGANLLTIGKRENFDPAAPPATTPVDYVSTAVVTDMVTDPDELKEDAAPLYAIDGPPDTAATAAANISIARAVASAGSGLLTLWYTDVPA